MKELGMRVMIVHGEQDHVVSPDDAKKIAVLLTDAGMTPTVHMVQGPHRPEKEALDRVREWLDEEVRAR